MKHKCHLCSKQYQSQNDLVDHMKKIHGLSVAQVKQYTEEEKTEFVNQCIDVLEEIKMKYGYYIKVLKDLANELNQSEEHFHLGGDVENLITELEAIK